jgi:D-sedoheptulose 7-phosphate isomerase
MNDKNFIQTYFDIFQKKALNPNIYEKIIILKNIILETKKKKGRVILIGNGGSAAIASHVSVDLNKVVGIKSINFNEYDLITCLSNDYGYENWVSKALEYHIENNDLIIIISSSGNSQNLVNAAKFVRRKKNKLVTLTGFSKTNKLNKYSSLSLWIDSKSYNIIENAHQLWLTLVCDMIIGKMEYKSN